MKKNVYYSSEQGVRSEAARSGYKYIDARLNDINQEWGEYLKPFEEIDGCTLGCFAPIDDISRLRRCIIWHGVMMTTYLHHFRKERTQALELAEEIDWMGTSYQEPAIKRKYPIHPEPQKIGRPTAKKLDEWAKYLTSKREAEEKRRDAQRAYLAARYEEICRLFPEAKNTPFNVGESWYFTTRANGVCYSIRIENSGSILERIELNTYYYEGLTSDAERAARMMKNELAEIKPEEDYEIRELFSDSRIQNLAGINK